MWSKDDLRGLADGVRVGLDAAKVQSLYIDSLACIYKPSGAKNIPKDHDSAGLQHLLTDMHESMGACHPSGIDAQGSADVTSAIGPGDTPAKTTPSTIFFSEGSSVCTTPKVPSTPSFIKNRLFTPQSYRRESCCAAFTVYCPPNGMYRCMRSPRRRQTLPPRESASLSNKIPILSSVTGHAMGFLPGQSRGMLQCSTGDR